jgi:hypothetical protein
LAPGQRPARRRRRAVTGQHLRHHVRPHLIRDRPVPALRGPVAARRATPTPDTPTAHRPAQHPGHRGSSSNHCTNARKSLHPRWVARGCRSPNGLPPVGRDRSRKRSVGVSCIRLDCLWNIDKHRRLAVMARWPDSFGGPATGHPADGRYRVTGRSRMVAGVPRLRVDIVRGSVG